MKKYLNMKKDTKNLTNKLSQVKFNLNSDIKKEEKKILNRNNSASYIDRKEIKLFKSDLKPQDLLRAKLEKESNQSYYK
jgi:hypothetical protein